MPQKFCIPSCFQALVFIASCATTICAQAQNQSKSETTCTTAANAEEQLLQGEWKASIADRADAVMLYLGPHPEWQGMVKGKVERSGQRHAMVGDVHDGVVTLEESANGTNISATWTGEIADGSCDREIRGQYQEGEDAPIHTFVLRKHAP